MKRALFLWISFMVLGFAAAAGAVLGISEHARGIATQYWYGYSSGAPSTYYLAHPTLSADDTAVGATATQTLTNKSISDSTGTFTTLKWRANGQQSVDYGGGSSNSTLTAVQAEAFEVIASNAGGAANLIVPATPKLYLFKNSSGAAVTVKTATGTGIAVANAKYAVLYCDGTNVIRITADT